MGLGGEGDGDRSTCSSAEVHEQRRGGHRDSSANTSTVPFHAALRCRVTEDITFNNLLPLYNSKLLKAYASLGRPCRAAGAVGEVLGEEPESGQQVEQVWVSTSA